jgi:hypothetical protein
VLAPILFNIYTNDQPLNSYAKKFIYADDTAVTAQDKTFEEVEKKLIRVLEELATYHENYDLRPNPSKFQVSAFHIKNRQVKRKLNVSWKGQELEYCDTPKYLGVKLDRFTFKYHCQDTKMKVHARNYIIRMLIGPAWRAHSYVLRTTGLTLSIYAAEYAAPVWKNYAHAKKGGCSN